MALERRGLAAGPLRRYVAVVAGVLGTLAAVVAALRASAADNPYQRGPDPTLTSVAATRGTFTTAQSSVPPRDERRLGGGQCRRELRQLLPHRGPGVTSGGRAGHRVAGR